ncbi:GNAT family N-acetyltransferase [Chitinophaga qingshengii]|uniref:GNAT family N-acetyltransferase n=1 Tax=Chitinophaga qingshengii TaxID=1569794 RepID=A0ABR7TTW9_9BACT|nr:GNAT family N-acetyltransferase [Chitinophaga qingshengii]MBC9933057.1 GNAT family N-acetyltransferase [Chitinophaga qingshengii]
MQHLDVTLRHITADNVEDICDLSQTLSPAQRNKVADNGESIAVAHYSADAWFRAIYAHDEPVGFIMLHTGAERGDYTEFPGIFLWRLMIAGPYQGNHYGQKAIAIVLSQLIGRGISELYTSCGEGEASPLAFYQRLGFTLTGKYYDDEAELVLHFTAATVEALLG